MNNDENTSNPEGPSRAGALVVSNRKPLTSELLAKALHRDQTPSVPQVTAIENRRMVRRGRFFLSRHEQNMHGSVSRPIFAYWGHGIVVGEMVPDAERDGDWCFAAHDDFDLVPEFSKPSDWPEYVRTQTGWERKDALRKLDVDRVDGLIQKINDIKRLL